MNQFTERHYQALLKYLKDGLRSGEFKDGSKLPSEQELADRLSFNVPSLREALHLLEMFGLVTPDVDGGFRVSHDVSRGFTDVFSMMLLLDQLAYSEVIRMRRSIELQSLAAICRNITETQKSTLYLSLMRMMASPNGDRKADIQFHDVLISASQDKLAISLHRALSQFTGYSSTGRQGDDEFYYVENWDEIVQVHAQIYRSVIDGRPEKAAEAVYAHYDFLL